MKIQFAHELWPNFELPFKRFKKIGLKRDYFRIGLIFLLFIVSLDLSTFAMADYTWEGVPAGYGLVWSDEFNGTVGSAPNSANWTYDIGNGSGGWGNAELEDYTNSRNNSVIVADPNAVDNRSLAIIALDPGGNNGAVGDYTSARLVSSTGAGFPGQTFQYGYMEARVKMPYGDGIWPAFWMLGSDNNYGTSWPACGETDIMENIGNSGDQAVNHGSLHDGTDFTNTFTLLGGQLFHNAYHTFAALWQANQIQFYVDGSLYETVNASQQGGTWEFNNSFFFLLNLAVGGNYPGNPDSSTSFPQTMYVDYVRAYQSGQPTPAPVVQSTWRVHCGGDNYTDSQSNLWLADTNFTGGWPSYGGTAISGSVLPSSADQTLYQYQRYGNYTGGETVTYAFNVPTGQNYQVDLKFAETYWNSANQRQFNYSINGTTEATNFDIAAAAGGANKALDESYNNITPNTNGQIVVQFAQGARDNPSVGAIQIIPQTVAGSETPTPTRTNTPTPTYTPTPTPTIVFKNGTIIAFPNVLQSVSGTSKVTFQATLSGADSLQVAVYDTAGELVKKLGTSTGITLITWDTKGLASGIYIASVEAFGGGQLIQRKILKILVTR